MGGLLSRRASPKVIKSVSNTKITYVSKTTLAKEYEYCVEELKRSLERNNDVTECIKPSEPVPLNSQSIEFPAGTEYHWEALEHKAWSKVGTISSDEQEKRNNRNNNGDTKNLDHVSGSGASSHLVRWFINRIGDDIKEELEDWSSISEAMGNFQFYSEMGDQGQTDLEYPLIRVTSYNDEGEVALDLLVEMKIIRSEVLKIRPIRLFLNDTAIKSHRKGTQIGISVNLTADGVYRNGSEGKKTEKVINVPSLLAGCVDVTEGLPHYQIFFDTSAEYDAQIWAALESHPLPPMSQYGTVKNGGCYLSPLKVDIAEATKLPMYLEWASKKLPEEKTDLILLVETAAKMAERMKENSTERKFVTDGSVV